MFQRMVWVALLLVAALAPAAQAQKRLLLTQPEEQAQPASPAKAAVTPPGPAKQTPAKEEPPVARAQPPEAAGPAARVTVSAAGQGLSVRTTVIVPDGGTAVLGSYSQAYESRSEYGAPILSKIPVVSRGARNVGYGRSVSTRKAGVSVRVIDLREEEFRQTGFRSP